MQYDATVIKDFSRLSGKKKKIGVAIIFSSLILASLGYAQGPAPLLSNGTAGNAVYQRYLEDQDKRSNEINYLLALIDTSPLSFERNGQKGSGKAAAMILKIKLNQNKNKIHTTEDFIEKVASFSSHTNISYFVILPEGKKLLLKDLLYAEIKELRNRVNKEANSERSSAGGPKL
jgi:hypothetical protein